MYTILLGDDNQLTVSVEERIMQQSKLVDNLHFLVEPVYKEQDMSGFTCLMEYLPPVSKRYKSEILSLSDEPYKGMLEYRLPFDTNLTAEAGDVAVQLTFYKVEMEADGTGIKHVPHTGDEYQGIADQCMERHYPGRGVHCAGSAYDCSAGAYQSVSRSKPESSKRQGRRSAVQRRPFAAEGRG